MSNVTINKNICKGCGRCPKICQHKVIKFVNKKAMVDPNHIKDCTECGDCATVCKVGAISMYGQTPSLINKTDTVINVIKKSHPISKFKSEVPKNILVESINICLSSLSVSLDYLTTNIHVTVIRKNFLKKQILTQLNQLAMNSSYISSDTKKNLLPKEDEIINSKAPDILMVYVNTKDYNQGKQESNIFLTQLNLLLVSKGYGSLRCDILEQLFNNEEAMKLLHLQKKLCVGCLAVGYAKKQPVRETPRKNLGITFID
ncbi:4Fe-4S ferredoxin-type domain-containing protein [Entamoeba marina]